MNVYDFDNTIYDGDSTLDYYLFCLKRHKKILLLVPHLAVAWAKYYVLHTGTKTQFKEAMYKFLRYCDTDNDVSDFWKTHKSKIKDWYLSQKKSDDVIISASPEFLLCPLKETFGFDVIASKVDKASGKYSGINCYYDEKVRRFYEVYPDAQIDSFYSDHYSDEPLAKIAEKAYIVEGNKILDWNFDKHIKPKV